jgi:hypothetical protein
MKVYIRKAMNEYLINKTQTFEKKHEKAILSEEMVSL